MRSGSYVAKNIVAAICLTSEVGALFIARKAYLGAPSFITATITTIALLYCAQTRFLQKTIEQNAQKAQPLQDSITQNAKAKQTLQQNIDNVTSGRDFAAEDRAELESRSTAMSLLEAFEDKRAIQFKVVNSAPTHVETYFPPSDHDGIMVLSFRPDGQAPITAIALRVMNMRSLSQEEVLLIYQNDIWTISSVGTSSKKFIDLTGTISTNSFIATHVQKVISSTHPNWTLAGVSD